jgi:hypothetical protein
MHPGGYPGAAACRWGFDWESPMLLQIGKNNQVD